MHQPPPQRIVTRRGANHGLHVFLTLITCGIWAVTGWPAAAALGRKTKTTVRGGPGPYYPPGPPPPHGQYPPPPGQYPPPPPGPPRRY